MLNKIITPLGDTILRKKYERQIKFKVRAYTEYRQRIKDMFKTDFKNKEYNGAIYKLPILDVNGIVVMDYYIVKKRVKNEGTKWKYLKLKLVVEVDEDA